MFSAFPIGTRHGASLILSDLSKVNPGLASSDLSVSCCLLEKEIGLSLAFFLQDDILIVCFVLEYV